ncbi:MAG: ribonuclease J [Defluviitaleaceae bacterium]|nr:ribonuclease J [Defluviitaleaceae bacterium]
MASKKSKLRVISLGGLQEIGKNITVLEYGNDIIAVDCGVAFPEDDMLGIDLVIPDFSYLVKNKAKVRGVFLTHGHEDHIGALPYFLKELDVPVYGTRLTLGLLESKFKEHGVTPTTHVVEYGNMIDVGKFKVEFIRVTHSIADSAALAIHTPIGIVVHSGDLKVDYTPIHGEPIDLARFAELGKKGVKLFMCESTNVGSPGYAMSERSIGPIFEKIFQDSPNNRIMVATFSSNIHRIQQIVNCAIKHNRKVCFIGRSMLNAVKTSSELGYLDIPKNLQIEPFEIKNFSDEQLVIITTGTQGEPMAALSRIAAKEHKQVEVKPGDKIIISASPIPGNEKTISKVINELMKKGATVIYEGLMDVHVSGHAKQEEIKLLHALLKPQYLMPIHGEYRHLRMHKELALSMGMKQDSIFLMQIGEVLEVSGSEAKLNGEVPSGQVFVDGLGVGDVGNIVLRDRRILSQDGLIIIVLTTEKATGEILSGPDIISRGFVYVRESENLMDETRTIVQKAIDGCEMKNISEWQYVKGIIKDALRDYLWQKTKRNPMILPIIMEV